MKVVIRNRGKKQIMTPWPFKEKVNAGKKKEFEVPDQGTAAMMVLGYAVSMEERGVEIRIFKGKKKYKVVRSGALPTLEEV